MFFLDDRNTRNKNWRRFEVILEKETKLLVFEAVRGGSSKEENEGDIAIDDIRVQNSPCGQSHVDKSRWHI